MYPAFLKTMYTIKSSGKVQKTPSQNTFHSISNSERDSRISELFALKDLFLHLRKSIKKFVSTCLQMSERSPEGGTSTSIKDVHTSLMDILHTLRNIMEKYPPITSREIFNISNKLIDYVQSCGSNALDMKYIRRYTNQLASNMSQRIKPLLEAASSVKTEKTFGVDLTHHLCDTDVDVPFVVTELIGEIERRGMSVGLYRKSGVKSESDRLIKHFDDKSSKVWTLETFSTNVLGDVLRQYLRQLPVPLLTFNLQDDFLEIGKKYASEVPTIELLPRLIEIMGKIPRAHIPTIIFLLCHLKRVTQNLETKMDERSVGVVFAPTLLREKNVATSCANAVTDIEHRIAVVQLMVTYAEEIKQTLCSDAGPSSGKD